MEQTAGEALGGVNRGWGGCDGALRGEKEEAAMGEMLHGYMDRPGRPR